MADGGNVIGKFADELEQPTKEAGEELKDAVGEAIEQGVQSVFGPQLTPQQIQQKQVDDQKQLTETRRKLEFYTRTDQEQKRVAAENKQKEEQRLQNQKQEEKEEEVEKEEKKKQPINPAIAYAGKVEIKRGVGG